MATTAKKRMTSLLLDNKNRTRSIILFVCVSVFICLSVASILRRRGIAQVHTEQVLDCPVTSMVAHTHNADCYDKDGNLVCPLPEIKLHVHDDSCYTITRTLVCDKEEGADHKHDDSCYEVTRSLTCGREEVTEEHVHGPGCFQEVIVDDGEPEESEEIPIQTTAT